MLVSPSSFNMWVVYGTWTVWLHMRFPGKSGRRVVSIQACRTLAVFDLGSSYSIEFFRNYDLNNFVKLVKLVKNIYHWWGLNPGPRISIQVLSQIGH